MSKDLIEVLNGIEIEDCETLIVSDLVDQVKKEMEGWNIEWWDADDYPDTAELIDSILYHVESLINEGKIKEFQRSTWFTGSGDSMIIFVASK